MTKREVFDVIAEPRGQVYESIIDLAARKRLVAVLVQRHPERISPNAKSLLIKLSPWIVSREEVTEWPGTVLHRGTASLSKVLLGQGAELVLKQAASRLYAWVHPELLEDLGFLRKDGSPWFASICHEADAYFELDREEFIELTAQIPELQIRPSVDDDTTV